MANPDILRSIIGARGGPNRFNRYKVIFPIMFVGDDPVTLNALCKSITYPGKSITSMKKQTTMRQIEMPTGYVLEPIQALFMETNDHVISRYMTAWHDMIVNKETYAVAYRDDIVRDILILKLDQEDRPVHGMRIKNAFPKSRAQYDLSDNNTNTITEFTCIFEYEEYEELNFNANAILDGIIDSVQSKTLKIPTKLIRKFTKGLI